MRARVWQRTPVAAIEGATARCGRRRPTKNARVLGPKQASKTYPCPPPSTPSTPSARRLLRSTAIRLDRRAAFGRAGRGSSSARPRGVSGADWRRRRAAGARGRRLECVAYGRRGSLLARRPQGVFGASGAGAVDRTSSRRDASSHRRLEPAGAARKGHEAARAAAVVAAAAAATTSTPQSGQVKRAVPWF